ncbi:putative MFS family arabinose efflux permease [Desulfitobacterium sp. LBE]|uniref:MFS transporter n=1 Tax=Desulfitobacterium sp. LBE TaxID=884086 RepID=UPI001199A1AC|nr:MFS transporter [Desulfitobacterium sp. LBE]TWH58293.1 putative MFS family arabinose efflux permease [Desulfitobacterium sp. LBE]
MKKNPWVVAMFVILTGVTFAMGQFKVPPTMTAVMEDMGVGLTMGGLLMSVVAITAIVCALFGGILTVKFRPKKLGMFALGCTFLGNLVGFFAKGIELLLVGRLLEGVGFGLITVLAPTIIAEWFPGEKRGRPMALWTMWAPCGILIIFNVSNIIMEYFTWRGVWAFTTILFAVMLVLFKIFVDDPEDAGMGKASVSLSKEWRAISLEIKSPEIWMLTLVFTIFGLGCAAYSTFAPTFCVEHLGMDLAAANIKTSLMTFGMVAGVFFMTAILSYIKNLNRLLVIVTVITGIFFSLSFCLNAEWQVIPFVLVNGIVLQMIPPVVFAVAPDAARSPQTLGVALGIATAGDHLGAFVGTVVLGAIVERYGGNWLAAVPAMILFSLIGIIGAVNFWYLMKRRRKNIRTTAALAQPFAH